MLNIYYLCINLITFVLFGIDKIKAIRSRWRIKEATLIRFSLLGGGLGGLLGMLVFRHKIRKPKFYLGVPACIVLHIIIWIFLKGVLHVKT